MLKDQRSLEIAAQPAVALALAHDTDRTGPQLFGLTLQHPPANMFVYPAGSKPTILGARADHVRDVANRFIAGQTGYTLPKIDIDTAIPNRMGLSSSVVMALATAHAVDWANGAQPRTPDQYAQALELPPRAALGLAATREGGALRIDCATGTVLGRHEIEHEEFEAWALALVLQNAPADAPDDLEDTQLAAAIAAAPSLPDDTASTMTQLWDALTADDFPAFGEHLQALSQANHTALHTAGIVSKYTDDEHAIFTTMRAHGCVAWGRTLGGYALWGLVQGGQPSRNVRTALRKTRGFFGGRIMATVCHNAGLSATETTTLPPPKPPVNHLNTG